MLSRDRPSTLMRCHPTTDSIRLSPMTSLTTPKPTSKTKWFTPTASRQRKIKNRSIRGIVLNENADDQARFDLFERINTGSKTANDAEIRRGALTGPFLDLVIDLAKDPLFITLTPVSDKRLKEREREELVTRFFAYGDGLDDYADE